MALKAIEGVLKKLDATELDPDHWEEHCLIVAMGKVGGKISSVLTNVSNAMS